ncbi:hypothetical protein [Thiomicrospira cyclica]|jgi:hypothetical protein|uniref:Uncharacterized protein n=1 Tax=Thiomicrospira cyclica (strain DSM 14477 / JCM 11371 / ALM1) TaxID=717773 RepID=F6DCI6_THICA|nr:hypothetical protein [Thiomicrospira cyclica]AEG31572.1 hypothetical protein Thicy_0800 [Thiomicrospira cyclica ALM1]
MGTSITLSNVFEAMGIMVIGTIIAITIVTLVMIGLHRFFKNDPSEKNKVAQSEKLQQEQDENHEVSTQSKTL